LPFSFNASVFHDIVPRSGVRVGERTEPVRDSIYGATTGLSYSMPGEFDNRSVSLSYTLSTRDPSVPIASDVDPYAPTTDLPFEGILSSLRLAASYSATQRNAWSISEERGLSFSLSGDLAGRETGSEETLQAVRGRVTTYLPVPGLRHHVLASSLGAGASAGSYPSRGFFFTGGFTERDLVEDFQSGIRQGAFLLRGYDPGQFVGRRFALLNTEYRFPLWYADRGISTLPAFLRTLSGRAYFDYGGAFDELDPDSPFSVLHPAVGGEIRLSVIIGYTLSGTLAWGLAQGLDDEAPDGPVSYMVLSGAF
jgi:hypothetical protein